MPCLTDEQIERLAAAPDDPAQLRLRAHALGCAKCGKRLEQARVDAGLISDIRELREHRDKVKPLLDEMSDSGRPIEPDTGNRV